MRAGSRITAAFFCALTACAGRAGEPRLETLFSHRAEVQLDRPAEGGLLRLELPIEVVSLCRSDLSDLRLFGMDGRVIGFATDLGPPPGYREIAVARYALEVDSASRSRVDLPGSEDLLTEAYVLRLPEGASTASAGGAWDLVIEAGARAHLRRVTVEELPVGAGIDARGREIRRGSIFRLAGNAAMNDRLSLAGFSGARLRVRLTGQGTRFLEPRFRLETSWPLRSRDPDWVTLSAESVRQEGGTTVLELARPPGLAPEWIEIDSKDRTFLRPVEITDLRAGEPDRSLGRGTIYELPRTAEHPALSARAMRVGRARGDRLRITIQNGDSAPLRRLVVRAGQRRPYLIFPYDADGEASGPIAMLLFGGGRVDPPRFDVAALLDRLPADVVADQFREARLGPARENPAFSVAPILAYAHRPGAELDTAAFHFRRGLSARPSPDGLNRVDLAAEDLAVLEDDLRDLRIVDDRSRQWAYLIERSPRTLRVTGSAERIDSEDGASRYLLRFPFENVPIRSLTLDAEAPFFDRHYELVVREERFGEPDRTRIVSQGRLKRRAGEESVSLRLPDMRATNLEMLVTDGDDAPLVFTEVVASVPLVELFFPAPEGEYRLILGNEDAAEPRYELERIRDVVLAVSSAPARTASLEANPDYRARAGSSGRRILFWGAILLAVAVLTILTLRLARAPETG